MNILDTGENLVLVAKGLNKIGYEDGLKLYKMLDISFVETEIDIEVSIDLVDFIYKSIGRIFSNNVNNNLNTLTERLKKDIFDICKFDKIKNYWLNLNIESENDEKLATGRYNITGYEELLPDYVSNIKESLDMKYYEKDSYLTKHDNLDKSTWILYNNIYNISLVVDYSEIRHIESVLMIFPEFKLAFTYNNLAIDLQNQLRSIFHKKVFGSLEIINEKIFAFSKLFNLEKQEVSEKNKIKDYIDSTYIISNDVDKRIKATDLYKDIINNLCISYNESNSFKKKVAGYLMELNLQKKRFSDAYYYYGLVKKDISKLSLEEIERLREKEKNIWTNKQGSPPFNNKDLTGDIEKAYNIFIKDRKI